MAVTQGTLNKSIVSAVELLDQREIDPDIYDQSRDRALTNIAKLIGRRKETSMPTYNNWTNEDVYENCTVSVAASPNGFAQITFTVNTNTRFPRRGDTFQSNNPNNVNKQGIVTNVTLGSGTAAITVRSVGGNSSPLWASVGDVCVFGSNAQGEKSDAPTNRRYSVQRYFNQVQIFREVDEITDVQKVSKVEFEVNGQYYFLPYSLIQKVIKLNADISYQMIAGVKSETLYSDSNPFLTDPNSNLPIQTTGGLNWYNVTYGITDSAASLGAFGFTEMNEIIDNWIGNKAPLDQMAFYSSRVKGVLDVFFKNLGSSGVTSVRMMIDGRTIDMEVEQVKYRGAVIDFIHLPILDHPQLFSNTLNAEMANSIFFIPKDQVETVDNGRQPRMQIRYQKSPMSGGGGANVSSDGVIDEWKTGALAPVPTSDVMQLKTNWYTNQGLECIAVKHFQRYRVL
jgi:hypothetical protein